MSRQTTVLASLATNTNYEYITTDGVYVYATSTDNNESNRLTRFEYDGNNTALLNVWTGAPLGHARGLVVYDDIIWIVARDNDYTSLINAEGISGWGNTATGTSYFSHTTGVHGGHGLVADSTNRYLYMTSEQDFTFVVYDTSENIEYDCSTTATFRGIARKNDTHYYLADQTASQVWEFILDSDKTTVLAQNNVSIDVEAWQIAYDNVHDYFYVSVLGGGVFLYNPTYSDTSLTALTRVTGEDGTVLSSDAYSTVAMYGYSKLYDDHNTYFDIFASNNFDGNNLELIYNNTSSNIGGDPQIRTLSGKIYTVPDYLTSFNYLTLKTDQCLWRAAQELKIDCTTRKLSEIDFPKGVCGIDGFNPKLCPHTYLDTVNISKGSQRLVIKMDTLEFCGTIDGSHITTKISAGMPATLSDEPHPLLDTTKYLEIYLPSLNCRLSLWSDLTILDRHAIKLHLRPLSNASMSGAVVDMPCHTFVGESRITRNCIQENTVTVTINGENTVYHIADIMPESLTKYINEHSFKIDA